MESLAPAPGAGHPPAPHAGRHALRAPWGTSPAREDEEAYSVVYLSADWRVRVSLTFVLWQPVSSSGRLSGLRVRLGPCWGRLQSMTPWWQGDLNCSPDPHRHREVPEPRNRSWEEDGQFSLEQPEPQPLSMGREGPAGSGGQRGDPGQGPGEGHGPSDQQERPDGGTCVSHTRRESQLPHQTRK